MVCVRERERRGKKEGSERRRKVGGKDQCLAFLTLRSSVSSVYPFGFRSASKSASSSSVSASRSSTLREKSSSSSSPSRYAAGTAEGAKAGRRRRRRRQLSRIGSGEEEDGDGDGEEEARFFAGPTADTATVSRSMPAGRRRAKSKGGRAAA